MIRLLLLAFATRIFFVYPQFSGDVKNHIIWGISILESGTYGLYSRHFPGFNDINYPPLAVYLFGFGTFLYLTTVSLTHFLNNSIGTFPSFLVHVFETENMHAAFLKLPSILADVSIGYLILAITKRRFLAALYLFNPAVIYISSVWGQIESIPILFLILSYFLLPKRYYLSHLSFTFAMLAKQTALWLLPIYMVLWWKEGNLKKILIGLTFQLITFIVLYFPFTLSLNPFSLYLTTLSGSSNSVTDQAFNLWYFIFGWEHQSDSILLFGLSVRFWSLVLIFTSTLVLITSYLKKYRFSSATTYLFLVSLVAFFFQTRIHERHLAPALPFLLISLVPLSLKLPSYFVLSTYHLINLYLALRLPFL